MHHPTSNTAAVASTYASHVAFPARAKTSGIVAAGVVVGAMVDTDCASVSMGERMFCRKPYPAAALPFGLAGMTLDELFPDSEGVVVCMANNSGIARSIARGKQNDHEVLRRP